MFDDVSRSDNSEPLILTISMFDNSALFVQSFFFLLRWLRNESDNECHFSRYNDHCVLNLIHNSEVYKDVKVL